MLKSEFKLFLNFFINLDIEEANFAFYKRIIYIIFFVIVLFVCQTMVNIILITLFEDSSAENALGYSEKAGSIYKSHHWFILFILAPAVEELMYRLPLVRFKEFFVKISISLLLGNLLSDIIYSLDIRIDSFFSIDAFLEAYLFGLAFLILIFKINFDFLKEKWNANIKVVIWVYIFVFTFSHLPQYLYLNADFLTITRSIINIGLLGFLFSFVRLRYGFFCACAIHMSYNYLVI